MTRKMTGSVHQFKVAAAAGKVSIDRDSAEAMATKVDAIADRAERRLGYFRFLRQDVKLGSSPVAKLMSQQDQASAAGFPDSAYENLLLYIETLRDLASAIRASARATSQTDEDSAASMNQIDR
ncbi:MULTISPECIES: hypothetical protein [Actinoalloteichus]|nr:hypothetical protein [Actinoalloteichus caeruleus]